MRIPLDYYRILGVPIQATDEHLAQAHHDRSLQLPRREYSEAAIAARKKLLEEAYNILSDSDKRSDYNARFLETTYQAKRGIVNDSEVLSEYSPLSNDRRQELNDDDIFNHTPWIEIDPEQFIGGLIILQELGEYELVLRLGIIEIDRSEDLSLEPENPDYPQILRRADIILTLALTYLELGREQCQQTEYQNAAISTQIGLDLLAKEGLFPSLQSEMQADLYKLRPYRVLELIATDKKHEQCDRRRTLGLQLLQEMLDERHGIDGKGDDRSGLNIDGFLRFIQQLRQYLSANEQQELFEKEAKRPSAVSTYLAIYTSIAIGFAHKKPDLILKAQEMLHVLSKRQDVYLEQAICALLLGQTEDASLALQMSKDKEPLEYIRQHSQGAPDLLPGLCLYGEHWLHHEVLSQFKDLAGTEESLKSYFADEQVQAYLEQLPLLGSISHTSNQYVNQTITQKQKKSLSSKSNQSDATSTTSIYNKGYIHSDDRASQQQGSSETNIYTSYPSSSTTAVKPFLDHLPGGGNTSIRSPQDSERNWTKTRSKKGSEFQSLLSIVTKKTLGIVLQPFHSQTNSEPSLTKRSKSWQLSRNSPYWLLIPVALIGVGSLAFIGTKCWLDSCPLTAKQEEQLTIPVAQPLVKIPPAKKQLVSNPTKPPEVLFNAEAARNVVKQWLASKSQAFGPQHDLDQLNTILMTPVLEKWRKRAEDAQALNSYMQYRHSVQIRSVQTNKQKPDLAIVEAQIKEIAKYYWQGKLDLSNSYDDTLLVRYELVRQKNRWLIKNITVVK